MEQRTIRDCRIEISAARHKNSLRIISCNIRKSDADDGDNNWNLRKTLCSEIIRECRADIICFQEMRHNQFTYLADTLPQYRSYGLFRDPQFPHPINAVFYKNKSFTLINAGGFWLSQSPHLPGSRSWGSASVRLANWLLLRHEDSGKLLRVINTHLDHISEEAKMKQTKMLIDESATYPDTLPQILTGDFNGDLHHPLLASLTANGWVDTCKISNEQREAEGTFHNFLGDRYQGDTGKIDWILAKGNIKAISAEVITTSKKGRYPSDHYFVQADMVLP